MEKLLKRLTGPAIAIVIMALTLNIVMDNPYTHKIFRAALNEKISEYTFFNLDFEALSVTVIPLGIDLYGANLQIEGKNQRFTIAKSSHILARISIWSLLMGTPRLGNLEAIDLEITWPPPWEDPKFLKEIALQSTKKSGTNISWPPAFNPPVESIALKNAKLYFESANSHQVPLRADTFYAVLLGVDTEIDIQSWEDVAINSTIQSIDLAHDSAYLLESTKLEFSGHLNKDKFRTDTLQVNGERLATKGFLAADLDIEKKSKNLRGLTLNGEIDSQLDFTLLGSILDIADTRGPVAAKAKFNASVPINSTTPADFKVQGSANFNDTYLYGFKLFNSSSDFIVTKNELSLENINIKIDDQSYGTFAGKIDFNEKISYEFKGKPNGLHLIDLLAALNVDFDDFDFAIFSENLSIKGLGQPFSMKIAAAAELFELRVPKIEELSSDFPNPPSCRANVAIDIDEKKLAMNLPNTNCFLPPETYIPTPRGSHDLSPPRGSRFTSTLDVAGDIRFDESGMNLSVSTENIDLGLGQYFAKIPLSGKATATTRIYGPYQRILVDNKVSTIDLRILDVSIGTASGKAVVDGTSVSWKDVHVSFPDSGHLTSSTGNFSAETMAIEASVRAQKISASALRKALDGIVSENQLSMDLEDLTADISGPLLLPGRIRGKISASIDNIVFDNQIVADHAEFKISSSQAGWSSDHFSVEKSNLATKLTFKHTRATSVAQQPTKKDGGFSLEGIGFSGNDRLSAALSIGRRKSKSAKPPGKSLDPSDHLQALPFIGDTMKSINLIGLIDTQAKFDGYLSKIQGTFSGKIDHLSFLGSPLAPIRFQGFLNGSSMDLTFDHSGNSLKGRLSTDFLARGLPYEWYLSLNKFDIRPLGTKVFSNDPRNYAYLTADWQMEGNFSNWWNSEGILNISDFILKYVYERRLDSNSVTVDLSEPQTLTISRKGWQLKNQSPLVLSNNLLHLAVSTGENLPPNNLDITVAGSISAEMAKLFSEQVESTKGRISFQVDIGGSISSPKIAARIENLKKDNTKGQWEPLSIGIADIRPAFEDINFVVEVVDGIATIKNFSAEKGSGRVDVTGVVDLTQSTDIGSNIQIKLDDAAVTYPVPMIKSFDSVLDGQILISGKAPPYKIGGDITIAKSRSTRPFDITTEIVNALRKKSLSSELRRDEPLVTFGLNITADRSIVIKNRNIDVLLSTNLRITGTDIAPIVSGQTQVEQGKFVYKQNFEIDRGLVTFDDPVRLDPSLDIIASADVPPYKVLINISGKASDPIVAFSVEPPTREDGSAITSIDIIVLLSRGSLPKGKNLTDAGGTFTSEAVNIIAGQIRQPLEALFDLSGQTFIKQFYVDSYASERDGSPLLRFNVPINLAKDLDVVFSRDRDAAGASIEYPLHESISVSGKSTWQLNSDDSNATYNSDTGVDLKFRFAFP